MSTSVMHVIAFVLTIVVAVTEGIPRLFAFEQRQIQAQRMANEVRDLKHQYLERLHSRDHVSAEEREAFAREILESLEHSLRRLALMDMELPGGGTGG